MSVAGVMSSPVTWQLEQTGPCDVEQPGGGGGCVVSLAANPPVPSSLGLLVLALLALARRRTRSGARSPEAS